MTKGNFISPLTREQYTEVTLYLKKLYTRATLDHDTYIIDLLRPLFIDNHANPLSIKIKPYSQLKDIPINNNILKLVSFKFPFIGVKNE